MSLHSSVARRADSWWCHGSGRAPGLWAISPEDMTGIGLNPGDQEEVLLELVTANAAPKRRRQTKAGTSRP